MRVSLTSNCFEAFVGSVTLNDNITSIPNYAFLDAQLGTFTMPANLVSIGASSFKNTDLVSVVLPNTCTGLGDSSFAGCVNLESITLGSVDSIPSRCFDGCTALASITWSSAIEHVGNNSFNNCTSLENGDIILPVALTELWNSAFCNLSITEITYEGTKANWADVDKDEGWTNCITTVHCSDGDITL